MCLRFCEPEHCMIQWSIDGQCTLEYTRAYFFIHIYEYSVERIAKFSHRLHFVSERKCILRQPHKSIWCNRGEFISKLLHIHPACTEAPLSSRPCGSVFYHLQIVCIYVLFYCTQSAHKCLLQPWVSAIFSVLLMRQVKNIENNIGISISLLFLHSLFFQHIIPWRRLFYG